MNNLKYQNIAVLICMFLFLVVFKKSSFAQSDSSTFQNQRTRVNKLLSQRSIKFGQYDESLKKRSGIFGLQTKKDLRSSNEILRQVVLNDNQIFKEIKALMEYKDLENQKKITQVDGNTERVKGYMYSIKKLQDQQKLLQARLDVKKKGPNGFVAAIIGLILGCVTTLGVVKFKQKKADN